MIVTNVSLQLLDVKKQSLDQDPYSTKSLKKDPDPDLIKSDLHH